MRRILRTVTPAILTSDLGVREHWGMIRAAGFPTWYAVVPGVGGWAAHELGGEDNNIMKLFRSITLFAAFAAASLAQTGPGTVFFFGTHHYADQVLEPYPVGGLSNWYIVRPPTPASYYSFQNLLDVHSITVYKNGAVLTSQQGPPGTIPDYGYFVLSSFTQSSQVVIILSGPVLPTDRLRVSYDYVQQ